MNSGRPVASGVGAGPVASAIDLTRDAFGRLVLTGSDGLRSVGVVPVRAFPLSAPEEGIALIGADGRERCWLEHLSALAPGAQALIAEELAARDFSPEIRRIDAISFSSGSSHWQVMTDRGPTRFTLRSAEAVRRLANGALQFVDDSGVHYLVRDPEALDARSRRLIDRHR